ncbi:MAG: hypothetical protein V4550_10020 [Gemmatimonadota bacterium]
MRKIRASLFSLEDNVMGAGGAAVAAIVAAHAKRLQDVIDAFRVADATAPMRARSLQELGVTHESEVEELVSEGVVLSGPRGGTWYLDEATFIANRDATSRVSRHVLVGIAIAVLLIMGALALLVPVRNR